MNNALAKNIVGTLVWNLDFLSFSKRESFKGIDETGDAGLSISAVDGSGVIGALDGVGGTSVRVKVAVATHDSGTINAVAMVNLFYGQEQGGLKTFDAFDSMEAMLAATTLNPVAHDLVKALCAEGAAHSSEVIFVNEPSSVPNKKYDESVSMFYKCADDTLISINVNCK